MRPIITGVICGFYLHPLASARAEINWVPTAMELQSALVEVHQNYNRLAANHKDCTDTAFTLAQLIATNARADFDLRGSGAGVQATAKLGTGTEFGLAIDNGFVLSTHFSLLPNFSNPSYLSRTFTRFTQSQELKTLTGCGVQLGKDASDQWSGIKSKVSSYDLSFPSFDQIQPYTANVTTNVIGGITRFKPW